MHCACGQGEGSTLTFMQQPRVPLPHNFVQCPPPPRLSERTLCLSTVRPIPGRTPKSSYCWMCGTPPPPCISDALVQATVGVGTVLIWDLILIRYQT